MLRTLELTPTFRRQVALAGCLAVTALLAACGGKDAPAPVCAVTAVNVAPATGSIAVGESLNLSAAVVQTNCTGLTTTWTSSNPAVASVSSTGTVTGVTAGGPVLITAQAGGGSGSAAIVVTPAAIASITLTAPSAVVNEGQSVQVTARVADARGNDLSGRTLTWSSSNTAVATADGTGRVTGVSPGGATITARDPANPNVNGTVALTVRAVVQRVQVTAPSTNLAVGQTVALTATLTSTSNQPITDRSPTWTSSNPGVATVNTTGQVTGVSAGTTTIQATSDGVSGSVALTVSVPVVTTLVLSGVPTQAPLGLPINITPQVRDQNGNVLTGRSVRWSVSNARTAIVRPTTPFTACAAEGATCAFTGTKLVRIGANSTNWVYKEVTNGTPCTTTDVGDPITGSGGYTCEVAELPSTVGATQLRPLGLGPVTITARSVDAPAVLATATVTIIATGGKVAGWSLFCSTDCTAPGNSLSVGNGSNVWTMAYDDQAGEPNLITPSLTATSSNPAVLAVQNVADNRRTDVIAVAPGTATVTFAVAGGSTAPA
ncbi:MAG: Ig-like domain-containing protein, partial [Gemmatimonadetes bacterium]|nr:Ig-like domain-containing protein [Gemmatimonadota bacterium]